MIAYDAIVIGAGQTGPSAEFIKFGVDALGLGGGPKIRHDPFGARVLKTIRGEGVDARRVEICNSAADWPHV